MGYRFSIACALKPSRGLATFRAVLHFVRCMSARHVGDMLFPCEFRGIADSTRGFDDIVLGQVASALGFKGRRKLGSIPAQEMEEWTRWSTHVAMLDRYDNMTQVEDQTLPLYLLPSMHMSGSAH